jgi:hypothetical protein
MVLGSAVVFALVMLLSSDSVAARVPGHQSVLLASSQTIKTRVDAAERRRVLQRLSALQFGPIAGVISAEELDTGPSKNPMESSAGSDSQLLEIEVKASGPPRAQAKPLQSPIPFGLAAIVWGFRHPSEAWRIFLPIRSGTDHAQPRSHAEPSGEGHCAGTSSTAVKVA